MSGKANFIGGRLAPELPMTRMSTVRCSVSPTPKSLISEGSKRWVAVRAMAGSQGLSTGYSGGIGLTVIRFCSVLTRTVLREVEIPSSTRTLAVTLSLGIVSRPLWAGKMA